jgi:hypothetical protein
MSIKLVVRLTVVVITLGACGVIGAAQTTAPATAPATGQTTAKPTLAEIEAANKKIAADNATVRRTFTAGNEALRTGRLDAAIAAYREGLQTRPDEPALLSNLSEALRRRGTKLWNDGLQASEASAKVKIQNAAKKDFSDAAAEALKALQAINNQAAASAQQPASPQFKITATGARALAMRLVATKVDQSQAQAAWDAYREHIALVNNLAKRSQLKGEALQMLFDAAAYELAIIHSRAALKEDSENLDANRVLGLSLFASGDTVKLLESAAYLQRYVDKAADTDPLKKPAQEALEVVKAQKKAVGSGQTETISTNSH